MKFVKLRKVRGFDNQLKLANELKISRTTISMWEKGKSYPSIPTIYKLAKILKVTPEEVFRSFEVKEDIYEQ